MKKLVLILILLTFSIFSFSHSFAMGDISDESMQMTMGESCCPDDSEHQDNSLCEVYNESINFFQGNKEKLLKVTYFPPFQLFSNFSVYLDHKTVFGDISPPYLYRDIKNYSYSSLSGIIKNIA